jgi:hypothetical protein
LKFYRPGLTPLRGGATAANRDAEGSRCGTRTLGDTSSPASNASRLASGFIWAPEGNPQAVVVNFHFHPNI